MEMINVRIECVESINYDAYIAGVAMLVLFDRVRTIMTGLITKHLGNDCIFV